HGTRRESQQPRHIDVNGRKLAGTSAATHGCRTDAQHRRVASCADDSRRRISMGWSAAGGAIGVATSGRGAAGAPGFPSAAGDVAVETVAKGLDHPWAFAFLPAGRMLVTERPGRMRIVARDGALSPALGGVPKVFASGQGGLLDVVLDRG